MHATNLSGVDYSPHFTNMQTAAQRIAQSHAAEEVLELGCEPRSYWTPGHVLPHCTLLPLLVCNI